MILNFTKHFPWGAATKFEDKIDDRKKIHSIRQDNGNRWKPGMIIHLCTGARTKNYDCFNEQQCESVQSIEIQEIPVAQSDYCYIYRDYIGKEKKEVNKTFRVLIDGKALCKVDIAILAANDGFDTTHDFFKWFNKPFKGKIIHWTDFRY